MIVSAFFTSYTLGFHSLTQELNDRFAWKTQIDSKERFLVALQQMFPASTDGNREHLKSLTEKYHKYKMEYVKHLNFSPKEENLSKES